MGLFLKTPEFVNEYPLPIFHEKLQQGIVQLWVEPDLVNPELAAVTEITMTQAGLVVYILSLAGQMEDRGEAGLRSIAHWAKMNGAGSIRAICKDAQVRLFSQYGFKPVSTVIELEI